MLVHYWAGGGMHMFAASTRKILHLLNQGGKGRAKNRGWGGENATCIRDSKGLSEATPHAKSSGGDTSAKARSSPGKRALNRVQKLRNRDFEDRKGLTRENKGLPLKEKKETTLGKIYTRRGKDLVGDSISSLGRPASFPIERAGGGEHFDERRGKV